MNLPCSSETACCWEVNVWSVFVCTSFFFDLIFRRLCRLKSVLFSDVESSDLSSTRPIGVDELALRLRPIKWCCSFLFCSSF
jgi:hypothetical protein